MLSSNTGGVRRLCGLAAAGLLAMAVAACAASRTMQSSASGEGAIADVRVERDDDATLVTLVGPEDPVFTAFSQRDPDRIVVDLGSTHPDDLDAVDVYDGLVDEVMLSSYETAGGEKMTRVEVVLAMPGDYSVVPSEDGLVIRVAPLDGASREVDELAALDEDGASDPWAELPGEEGDEDVLPLAPLTEPPTPATRLVAVEARAAGEGSIVKLQADGSVASAESFTLENPDRLVIDLRGLKNEVGKDRIAVGTPQAERIRIGQHDGMVRIVVDGGEADSPFDGRRVVPVADGLVVALGSGPALEWAVEEAVGTSTDALAEEAPEEVPVAIEEAPEEEASDTDWLEPIVGEPEEEVELAEVPDVPEAVDVPLVAPAGSGPVTVYGVEFDSQTERDRIVVLGDRPVDYLVYEPSPDTVVLSIQNAVIDAEAAVRIAPEPGGPVSLVTAFEQPEVRGHEVRVVVKRAPNLKPAVSRNGSLIVLDFARGEGLAAAPPILETQPAVPGSPAPATPALTPLASAAAAAAAAPLGASAASTAASVAPAAAVAPASFEPAAAIDVLREGGLTDGKVYGGRRISLDFKDIDMGDVLRLIAEVSDLNVIAGEEVKGKVTIRLVDVPWDQALDVILLTRGLGFMRVGNVLRIAPAELLKQEEEARLQERRSLEQLEDLVVKLQPVNYANVKELRSTVQRLLSSRGTVDVDERTNTLIIKDIPSVIDEATALIKAIDTQTPQVLIEAKIVEANLDFAREFGTTWGFGVQPLIDAFDPASGPRTTAGGDVFRLNTTPTSLGNNASFINPLTAGPTALFNIAGFILDEKLNLDLQLQAAEINGDGKVISSPRVVTLDNNKATIEQGVSIPFQTFENGDAQLEFVDAVLKLDVTPHITADKSIIMEVKVSRNAPDDSVFTLTGSPAISKNQVDTETLVKDGQTLVLGGIYVVDKSHRQSRVPYLHRVPLIGALFRNDEQSDARKELLIFVTPRIVVTPQKAAS